MTGATSGLSAVRHVLSNGAVAIVQETAFSPAVTLSMAFRAGSLNEPDELPGLAFFLSRVIDRGTTSRSADAVAEALDDRGVALRTATNRHVVTLSCTCLSEDFAAVSAGIDTCYSNGQAEGQVNRLKLIKRSMYGRAGFTLLQARVLPMRSMA